MDKATNLRAIAQENNFSPREKYDRFEISEKKDAAWVLLDAWCRDLSKEFATGLPPWQVVFPVIRDHYPNIYVQLITNIARPGLSAFTYEYWARGGDLATIESLHLDLMVQLGVNSKEDAASALSKDAVKSLLADIATQARSRGTSAGEQDIWRLSLDRTKKLLSKWKFMINKHETVSQLQTIHEEHKELLTAAKSIEDDRYVRAMLKQNVVGMTTTACASR